MRFYPIFSSRFPFIKFGRIGLFNGNRIVYEKFQMNGKTNVNTKMLVDKNRKLLLENRVPINKIRFVFQPTFLYDIDNDVINPKYDMLLPIKYGTGLFDKSAPVIEIGKPEKLVLGVVDTYTSPDNYALIKDFLKKSKKGIVIFVHEKEENIGLHGETLTYYAGVDDVVVRMKILDELIKTEE